MRVGVLEDDLAIQEMLLLVLQDEGYTVVNYQEAAQCLQAMHNVTADPSSLPVDLMIIDWRLDGPISGVEVIQQLRSNSYLQTLPLILTTAASFSDTEELKQLQVALLEKPFAVDEMLLLVKKQLQMIPPAS